MIPKGLLGGIGDAFADRNFRFYSAGAIVSWLTYYIQVIAFSWVTWELTRSTTWLAIVASLDVAFNVILLPIGGVLADRVDRFKIAIIAFIADCLKSGALALLAYTGALTLPVICLCAVLHGIIHSFSVPAFSGMMPRFVARERLPSAIAVSSSYMQLAIFAGPALAGWILVHWGAAAAFFTNFIGYLVYFAATSFLRTPQGYVQQKSAQGNFFGDIPEGLHYIFSHRGFAVLFILMFAGEALLRALYQLMPAYSSLLLGMGVGGVSILFGSAGLGATAASLWLAHGGVAKATPGRVLWAFLVFVLAALALAWAWNLITAVPAMLVLGFSGETTRTATTTLLQQDVSDTQRGRVMGTRFLLQRAAGGLGALSIGGSASTIGLRLPILVAAVLSLVLWASDLCAARKSATRLQPCSPQLSLKIRSSILRRWRQPRSSSSGLV